MKKFEKIYVLDTNIILNDATNILKLSQNNENLIIIPETVVNELDAKKTLTREFSEISWQAREFSRMLSDGEVHKTKIKKQTFETKYILKDGQEILIVGLHKYKTEGIDPKIINDRKIIQVAKHMSKKHNNVKLISVDMMCRIYANIDGVESETLDYGGVDIQNEFIKRMPLDKTVIQGESILEYDPEFIPGTYGYIFETDEGDIPVAIKKEDVGEFLEGDSFSKTVGQNYIVNIINKDLFRKSSIRPKNDEQLFALSAMQDIEIDMVILEAVAGSGKTLLALHSAIQAVKAGNYDRIVYIRNSVESVDKGEDVGYLSGNKEKFEIYNYPLYDTLDFLVRTKMGESSKKKDISDVDVDKAIEDMIKQYNISTMWVGAIRGRTIKRAYVIIDEVQNFSRKSLQTVLSRNDDDCKVVCIGSNRQIDNIYVNKYTNGLSLLLDRAHKGDQKIKLFATALNKVFRGRITEWAEEVFSNFK